MKPVDVAAGIDEGGFGGFQRLLIFATALVVILDGADNQLLPHAIPSLMREWELPRSAFATVSAAGPFGMAIGGVLGGIAGDRMGRRVALLGSLTWFAVMTLAIAFADSLSTLTVLRFLTGLGLGGAMPGAAALASEYVPRRQRPVAITLTIVCVPLGGFLAGLAAGLIVPQHGWRVLFATGGIVPILLSLALFKLLPESPRYLVSRPHRWPELRALLRRFGHPIEDDATFVDAGTTPATSRGAVGDLFSPDFRRDTLGLIGAFTFCLLAIYVGFLWIPAMLTDPQLGFSQPTASYALALFNFGGVAGALLGALAIQRFGSRIVLLAMSGASVASALAMAAMTLSPDAPVGALFMFTVTGGLLNAVQTTGYALAAHVYPTAIRGTGVGTTIAFGRVGNVLASYVGSWALVAGGPRLYFSTWAFAMTVVFVSLAIVRRHIPPRTAAGTSVGPRASRTA